MNILYEDASVIVAVKRRGVLSEGYGNGSMPSLLSAYLRENGEDAAVYPVHRLDRETAGVMVYAKTKDAAAMLSRAVAERRVEKEYLAVTEGVPSVDGGEMRDLLFRDAKRNKSFVVDRMRKGVREASLRYRVMATADGRALCRVALETGRTHQIRVQFASRRLPLVGDTRYGAKTSLPLGLFAYRLSFPHPKTGKPLTFSALPDDLDASFLPFRDAMRELSLPQDGSA